MLCFDFFSQYYLNKNKKKFQRKTQTILGRVSQLVMTLFLFISYLPAFRIRIIIVHSTAIVFIRVAPPLSKKKSAPPSFLVISTQKFTNYQPPFTKSPLKTFKLAAPPPFPKRTRKPFYTFLCFETFFNNKSFIKWIELKNVYKKPWLGSFVYIFSGRRPNCDLP